MGRAVVVAVTGTVIGVAIAGVPDRSQDPPLRLSPDGTAEAGTSLVTTSSPVIARQATTTSTTLRPPAQVRLMAVNASPVPGAARRAGNRLQQAGYSVAAPVADERRFERSFVRYRPGFEAEAATVASMAGMGADAVQPMSAQPSVAAPDGVQVVVVVGNDLARPS